jgi:predicted nuclease of predicted toxin-antitoxin system
VHVADIGLLAAPDQAILAHAASSGLVIISADTDFGELLAVSGAARPSVVLLRSADRLTPDQQATLLIANLPAVAAELDSGAAVSIARGRLRVRPLPVHPAPDPPGHQATSPGNVGRARRSGHTRHPT